MQGPTVNPPAYVCSSAVLPLSRCHSVHSTATKSRSINAPPLVSFGQTTANRWYIAMVVLPRPSAREHWGVTLMPDVSPLPLDPFAPLAQGLSCGTPGGSTLTLGFGQLLIHEREYFSERGDQVWPLTLQQSMDFDRFDAPLRFAGIRRSPRYAAGPSTVMLVSVRLRVWLWSVWVLPPPPTNAIGRKGNRNFW